MAAAGYAVAIEPRRLQAVRYRLGVADLPAGLAGTRIAHLTDFHVGMSGTRRATLRRAVALAAAWRRNLVALTGDFADRGVWERGAALVHPLARAAPTFAVLGNHDRLGTPADTDRVAGPRPGFTPGRRQAAPPGGDLRVGVGRPARSV